MKMVMINWLKLLAASEKTSLNFFNLKGDSVWSVTLDCAAKLSLVKGIKLRFAFARVGWDYYTHSSFGGTYNSWGPTSRLKENF